MKQRPDSVATSGAPVLVVEDNAINQMVFEGYLKKLGYCVLIAANGAEALTMLQQQPVVMVLMDCQMPVMDGFEATRRIRGMQGPLANVPIVAVTANAMDADRERCLQAGMDGFLKKPLALETLKQTMHQLMCA